MEMEFVKKVKKNEFFGLLRAFIVWWFGVFSFV